MDKESLLDLLILAQKDNEEAICYLVRKFQLLIKKFARQLNYDCAETDLIIYLLEFTKKLDTKKIQNYSEGELVNYIVRLLRNKKIDIYRKNNLALEEVHTEKEISTEAVPGFEEQICLKELLDMLSDKHKKVIIAKYIYGYSDAEIGTSLGISRQAVNKLKNKALEQLRTQMKAEKLMDY
ncbi:RNA polymerase sigma factor [Aminipila sp.]|uniref:RNA polymerase sigma factor n=1 Tax=Aminipila sp. TaxID=2060095 RepID=UPI0028A14BDC|nr:sigma-70 family RNA polymerase sigma factor [Aminipila sp.]